MDDLTTILQRVERGEATAEELLSLIYEEPASLPQ
jgi:hypothetical protein